MSSAERKIIGLDFDDVLLAFNQGFLDFNRNKYGLNIHYNDLYSSDYAKTFPLPIEETIRRVFEFCDSKDHKNASPISGAIKAVQALSKTHHLHIVTSRSSKVSDSVHEWVSRHFGTAISSVHFTEQFHGDPNKMTTKEEVCNKLSIEIFVEDMLHHARPIAESGRTVYLLDRPWNQQTDLHPNITRSYSWDEVVNELVR